LSSTRRVTDDLRKALRAAHRGQVQTLFVAADQEVWGTFDPDTQAIRTHLSPAPTADELLNLAAIKTYASGGAVYVLPASERPTASPLAALLRY
jgi:hypothetical protein